MAFTPTERTQIRTYLGWSARFAQFDGALARSFSAMETLPEDEAQVRLELAECLRIDAAIKAAEARFKADKVGTLELNRREIDQLRSNGRMHVGRIATTLGVEVKSDAFGADAPRFRAGPWGGIGGGNAQRQG